VYAGTPQPFAHSDERVMPMTLDVINAVEIQAFIDPIFGDLIFQSGRSGGTNHPKLLTPYLSIPPSNFSLFNRPTTTSLLTQ
jgi:hypothetical protein